MTGSGIAGAAPGPPSPTKGSGTVVLCQTAIGDYRQAALELLGERLGDRFRVWAGDEYFDPSLRTRVNLGARLGHLDNHFFLGRRLLWQSGALGAALSADVAILEFNPRIASVWLTLVWRRLSGRRSLLWGHAWSRGGPHSRTEPIRRLLRRLADGVVLYTHRQARELVASDDGIATFVAPNALYRSAEMQPALAAATAAPCDSFVYTGRLVPAKKPDVLLAAFIEAASRMPPQIRLVLVGDGPMRASLMERAAHSPVADRVEFLGHVSDPIALRDLYARAIAGVSPGAVGLAIIQSLGFGVPMIVAEAEPHGPELEAARPGWNVRLYAPSSAAALAEVLVAMADQRQRWLARRAEISADCRERYSAEAMVAGLLSAVDHASHQ